MKTITCTNCSTNANMSEYFDIRNNEKFYVIECNICGASTTYCKTKKKLSMNGIIYFLRYFKRKG